LTEQFLFTYSIYKVPPKLAAKLELERRM